VLPGAAIDRTRTRKGQKTFVTDSVAVDRSWPALRIVSIAPLVAAAIHQVLTGGSLSDL
jgi:phosphoribosylpyrophosphate synthetase